LSFPEVFRWADGAVAIPGAEEHRLLPVVLAVAAYGAAAGGDLAGANDHTDRALHLVDDPDDARRLLALGVLGVVLLWEGRLDDARRWIAEMLRVARASDNVRYQAMANSGGSMVESMAGDHATAVEMAESGYALARTGSSAMQAHALYYFGEALLAAGEFERALDCLDRSIELCRANQMPFFVNVALVAVASLRARHGDPLQALPMLGDVIDRWRRLADWPRQWVTLLNLVELLARLGVHEAAAVLLAASEASATAPPMFGPQAERLAELRRTLAERMGAKAYATAGERGPAMSDEDAVAYAKAEIDRALVAGAGP
jgi:ATP/maltotriose-dependent transcriptional regulator MalT